MFAQLDRINFGIKLTDDIVCPARIVSLVAADVVLPVKRRARLYNELKIGTSSTISVMDQRSVCFLTLAVLCSKLRGSISRLENIRTVIGSYLGRIC